MGIYPTPGNLLYSTSGSSLNESFNLSPGSYPDFVVQEWDKCGGSSKVALSLTVTASSVVSANGNSSGILWAVQWGSNVLHAYDALHLANDLYNSSQNSTRDALGSAMKFAAPLVVNGKVYVGTATQLVVYGLL